MLGGRAPEGDHRMPIGASGVAIREPEEADLLVDRLRLLLQRLGRGRVLLDQCRVLLGDLVHLGERDVDLVDAGRLLGTGGRISDTIPATRLIESTISVSEAPALLTSSTPSCTCAELLV